eukprot:scaffold12701_cov108-Skeletonema_menzelii.AAC.2
MVSVHALLYLFFAPLIHTQLDDAAIEITITYYHPLQKKTAAATIIDSLTTCHLGKLLLPPPPPLRGPPITISDTTCSRPS